jgi:hypothetical protein
VRKLRELKAETIHCLVGAAHSASALQRNGFLRRQSGWPMMVWSRNPEELLREGRNWFLTYAESNADRPR